VSTAKRSLVLAAAPAPAPSQHSGALLKRIVLAAAVLAVGAGTAGVSFAGEPGPNGHNNWGLCNAYAHNGGGNSHNAPPFAALQAAADKADQSVAEWCADNGQKPGGGK